VTNPLVLVFTGTGACGTGACAQYVTAAGLPCGHERVFGPHGWDKVLENLASPKCRPGESSWLAAPWLDRKELDGALVVHLRRHPQKVLSTMSRVREGGGQYWLFGAVFCPRLLELGRTWDGFAHRYVEWNRLIESKLAGREHLAFNIEGDPLDLMAELRRRGLGLNPNPSNPVYKRRGINSHAPERRKDPHYQFALAKLEDRGVRADLEEMAARYGYAWDA